MTGAEKKQIAGSNSDPVIVIHGVATRDRARFVATVAALEQALGGARRLVPVFWGDLGVPRNVIDEVLPYRDWVEAPRRELEATIAGSRQSLFSDRVRDALRERDADSFIRTIAEGWRAYNRMTRRAVVGTVFSLFREFYSSASAELIGDVLVYQNRKKEMLAAIRERIAAVAPGAGGAKRPLDVIAHSLGGVMLFDMATARQSPLFIRHMMTCGNQAGFLYAIGCIGDALPAHQRGQRTTLPATIKHWTNFYVPLDPWAFLAGTVFQLADGSIPQDIEVHDPEGRNRLFRHAADYYWSHPAVIATLQSAVNRRRAPEPDPRSPTL